MSDEAAFASCCGETPKITEWRPGCYGAQCASCGRIVGSARCLDLDELAAEWYKSVRQAVTKAVRGE